ncbi:MAG: hypothetical protein WCI74_11305 [Actinomycetes bacterium]
MTTPVPENAGPSETAGLADTTGPAHTVAPSWATWLPRAIGRWILAAILLVAGLSHLGNPAPFMAQVPPWFPAPAATIFISGVVEIALAIALVTIRRKRAAVGWIVAAYFVVIFPGNISQFVTHTSAFGLDTDVARGIRLLFQPLLVILTLWSTRAWSTRVWPRRHAATKGNG